MMQPLSRCRQSFLGKAYRDAPWWLLIIVLLCSSGGVAAQQDASAEPEANQGGESSGETGGAVEGEPDVAPARVVHLRWEGAIHPVAADYILEGLDYADRIGARALVLELNTPGGLLTSTREIFKAMLGARTPVVLWVGPSGAQAASAGFFLLMASDVAAMAPGTNTGAAHPVGGQGEDIEGHMGEKIEQDSAATIRSLARQHERNVELAEAAVVESRSFTAEEALAEGLVEHIAEDMTDLLSQIDGRVVEKVGEEPLTLATAGVEVERREIGALKRILAALVDPSVAYILMALGWLGIYMELSNPGTILPGVVGAICLVLGFYAMSVLPVNYAGVALLILSLAFFLLEIKVVSFGLLSIGGVVSLVLGSLLLFRDAEADPVMQVGVRMILGVSLAVLSLVGFFMIRTIQMRRLPVTTGAEGLLQEVGVARSALEPRGKVFVRGELWNAEAAEPVASGDPVEVVGVDGLTLRVRPRRT